MATLIRESTLEGARGCELRDTRLEVRYGAGGRLRVEFALDTAGRLMGRYLPAEEDVPGAGKPAGSWRVPSDWLERRELEDSDVEHVRVIGALRELLEVYGEGENV